MGFPDLNQITLIIYDNLPYLKSIDDECLSQLQNTFATIPQIVFDLITEDYSLAKLT